MRTVRQKIILVLIVSMIAIMSGAIFLVLTSDNGMKQVHVLTYTEDVDTKMKITNDSAYPILIYQKNTESFVLGEGSDFYVNLTPEQQNSLYIVMKTNGYEIENQKTFSANEKELTVCAESEVFGDGKRYDVCGIDNNNWQFKYGNQISFLAYVHKIKPENNTMPTIYMTENSTVNSTQPKMILKNALANTTTIYQKQIDCSKSSDVLNCIKENFPQNYPPELKMNVTSLCPDGTDCSESDISSSNYVTFIDGCKTAFDYNKYTLEVTREYLVSGNCTNADMPLLDNYVEMFLAKKHSELTSKTLTEGTNVGPAPPQLTETTNCPPMGPCNPSGATQTDRLLAMNYCIKFWDFQDPMTRGNFYLWMPKCVHDTLESTK